MHTSLTVVGVPGLRLQDCCLCPRRFDLFNVRLHEVKFDANGRSYFLHSLLRDEPEQKRRYTYRYFGSAA